MRVRVEWKEGGRKGECESGGMVRREKVGERERGRVGWERERGCEGARELVR